ncbi:MAG: histidinol dehydrogenase [Spirochaetaceae bacterium]|jgi:histidinol dehydrogenase/sulfopropanediol 3-dehydrogenase|nr:histidinol dehydrogenase [Spirochaetaceae bacterium]
MRTIKQPHESSAAIEGASGLSACVAEIIARVRSGGADALAACEARYGAFPAAPLAVDAGAVARAYRELDAGTLDSLRRAAGRIAEFARRQKACLLPLEYESDVPGLTLGHALRPVSRAGCYVPAGRKPLASSALMSIVTAKAAGVPSVAACSPATGPSGIHPAVLAAMDIAGADEIFCMGGAQAIAAFTFGAGPVAPVDFIAGPGNRYVTEAKRQLAGTVGIDALAGPSEVLIIADDQASAACIAADLLAQAEHDAAARAFLVCTSEALALDVLRHVEALLSRADYHAARAAWESGGGVYLTETLEEALAFANDMAPEHLSLQVAPERERAAQAALTAYGSLFVGTYAPVALGDFVSGPNHILPTNGTARFASGLWVGSFLRVQFQQTATKTALAALAAPALCFAKMEGLPAHGQSISIRLG